MTYEQKWFSFSLLLKEGEKKERTVQKVTVDKCELCLIGWEFWFLSLQSCPTNLSPTKYIYILASDFVGQSHVVSIKGKKVVWYKGNF